MFMLSYLRFIYLPAMLLFFAVNLYAEGKKIEIGIDEQLGKRIPMDLTFTDSKGNKRQLKEIVNKPVVLSLVYFHCPGICSPLLTGLSEVVDRTDLVPGKDYQVLSISFDHSETPATAAKWKRNYLAGMKKQIPDEGWIFMTGDSVSIRKLTDAVGFYFKPDGRGDFMHAGSLIILNPDGRVSRYMFGTEYNPFDLKMAVIKANEGGSMPTVNKILDFCFSYDPAGNKYALNVTKIFASFMIAGAAIFLTVLIVKGRKKEITEG